jgi:hypothetical protein
MQQRNHTATVFTALTKFRPSKCFKPSWFLAGASSFLFSDQQSMYRQGETRDEMSCKVSQRTCISYVTYNWTQFTNNDEMITSCKRPHELAKSHNLIIIRRPLSTQNEYLDWYTINSSEVRPKQLLTTYLLNQKVEGLHRSSTSGISSEAIPAPISNPQTQ